MISMGSWREQKALPDQPAIHFLRCGNLFDVELTYGPIPDNMGRFWRATWQPRSYANHSCVHDDLAMAQAKVDWCIVRDMRSAIEDYKCVLARTKAPDFKYKGGW